MAAITGKGPSARHEIFYLGESTVGAVHSPGCRRLQFGDDAVERCI